ncbi:MAG: NADH-quinone oxidoreductase subunit NuoG [bacterium]
MPTLVIDGRETEVAEGTKVIEAAEQLGIMIPRFCYHPALGPVGACRVCAVKFLQGPFKGVQMSCMIDARDGMVVSTTDEEAVDFRRHVIEWLMLHHPHDCPVCDEGGHCLLQDMTIAGGHGIRRYPGKKRTYRDQHLGPLVQHEMNRCIQCYRCSRYYQELAGYRDLGVMQIGYRVYFGRQRDGNLESPYAGNLIDLCPTGVYTDKPSRFVGRRWDYQRSRSLCIHCSLGCHLVASVRNRTVVRTEAAFSDVVNGHFICDRGRYGYFYASAPGRPRTPGLHGMETDYPLGLRAVTDRLRAVVAEAGPGAVACVGSLRSSLETQAMLVRLCEENGWKSPCFFADRSQAARADAVVSRLEPGLALSMREIEGADCIVAIGTDPVNEAPMLAMAMRQAERRGANVTVIDPRPLFLPLGFRHIVLEPGAAGRALAWMVGRSVERRDAETVGAEALRFREAIPDSGPLPASTARDLDEAAESLRASRRPAIVCGTEVSCDWTPALAADCVLLLRAAGKQAGLFYALPGANAFGAAMLAGASAGAAVVRTFERTLGEIENGAARALIAVEADPLGRWPDPERVSRALARLDLLVLLDHVDSVSARAAHVFLPTATLFEAGGIFVNQEGRAQKAGTGFRGGTPVEQTSAGSHPPRVFRKEIPGRTVPAWRILEDVSRSLSRQPITGETATTEPLLAWLAEKREVFRALLAPACGEFPQQGVRLLGPSQDASRFSTEGLSETGPGGRGNAGDLELFLVDWTFGTEELSIRSPDLSQVETAPCLFMHAEDAAAAGLADGDVARIGAGGSGDAASVRVSVCVRENMARGVLFLPRHRTLEWQKLGGPPVRLRREQITKI